MRKQHSHASNVQIAPVRPTTDELSLGTSLMFLLMACSMIYLSIVQTLFFLGTTPRTLIRLGTGLHQLRISHQS